MGCQKTSQPREEPTVLQLPILVINQIRERTSKPILPTENPEAVISGTYGSCCTNSNEIFKFRREQEAIKRHEQYLRRVHREPEPVREPAPRRGWVVTKR